ncbi:MAG: zf-HC2 domain-containing protein, partial [Oligoflexia bacterium]|nr:zf-HC2 domain-containing protein [Oligoflexia bacterium]
MKRPGNLTELSDKQIRVFEKGNICCTDVAALMGDYADQELMPSLRRRVDAHIERCDECALFRDTYLMVVKLAREIRRPAIPTDVQNRLRAKL